MEIVVATSNDHKLQEIRKILPGSFKILSMAAKGIRDEIPETGTTFTENALIKARYLARFSPEACLADDSGLVVDVLNGEPGVYSARYAGEGCSSLDNIEKLLAAMDGKPNRSARFITVLALIINGREFLFEGKAEGKIAEQASGSNGFGYDPVFIPENESRTFADMDETEKNRISHRARALEQLRKFLDERRYG